MNSDELEHELEQLRLKIANLKYSLDGAYPDWAEYGRAHLREYEEQERDLLAELERLGAPVKARKVERAGGLPSCNERCRLGHHRTRFGELVPAPNHRPHRTKGCHGHLYPPVAVTSIVGGGWYSEKRERRAPRQPPARKIPEKENRGLNSN
jgi:hypothetical protein